MGFMHIFWQICTVLVDILTYIDQVMLTEHRPALQQTEMAAFRMAAMIAMAASTAAAAFSTIAGSFVHSQYINRAWQDPLNDQGVLHPRSQPDCAFCQ